MASSADRPAAANPSAEPAEEQRVVLASDEAVLEVRHKGLLTAAVLGSMLLQILDTTIANVALPHMQSALGATQESITWVLTSYVLASAVATPITGWLADRIGARQLFLISVAGFIAASMLCGIAISLETMVLFRFIQGISGAFIAPLAQSLLFNMNSGAEQRRAVSMFAAGIMIGPIVGPMIGGWLTDNFNWRWVFYINVPTGLLCLALLFWLLPRQEIRRRSFDLFGFSFLVVALCSMQLLLDRGSHVDWFASTEIWIELCLATSCFWVFCVHVVTSRNPLFPAPMLRDGNLMAGTAMTATMGLLVMSTMALLPPMMQNLYGYSVVHSGMLMSTRGLAIMLFMPVVNYIQPKVDPRVLILLGYSIVAVSLWQMSGWTMPMNDQAFLLAGFIQGLGLGLLWVPVNLLSFATLAPRYRTEGSAMVNIGRSIGSSIGVAVMSATLARNLQTSHADLAQHITSTSLSIDPNMVSALGTAGDTVMAMIDAEVGRQAAMIAYIDDFRMMAIAILCVLPLVLLLKGHKQSAGDVETPVAME